MNIRDSLLFINKLFICLLSYIFYLYLFVFCYLLIYLFYLYLLVIYLFTCLFIFVGVSVCLFTGICVAFISILYVCTFEKTDEYVRQANEKIIIAGHIFHIYEAIYLNLKNTTFGFSEYLVKGFQRKLGQTWVALWWCRMMVLIFCVTRGMKDSMFLIFCEVPFTLTVWAVLFYNILILYNCDIFKKEFNCDIFDNNENCDIYNCIRVMAGCDIFRNASGCDIIRVVIVYIHFVLLFIKFLFYMLFIHFKSVIVFSFITCESRRGKAFNQKPLYNDTL